MEVKYQFVGALIRQLISKHQITDPNILFDMVDSIRRMKDWEVRGLIHAEKTK